MTPQQRAQQLAEETRGLLRLPLHLIEGDQVWQGKEAHALTEELHQRHAAALAAFRRIVADLEHHANTRP